MIANPYFGLIDKSKWSPGIWTNEPDKIEIPGKAYPQTIMRTEITGALCGYIGIPGDHPLFGVHYRDNDYENPVSDLSVHGGITLCAESDPPEVSRWQSFCHEEHDASSPLLWWLGFDCGHAGDMCPAYTKYPWNIVDGEYRDVEYVREQLEKLELDLLEIELGVGNSSAILYKAAKQHTPAILPPIGYIHDSSEYMQF